MVTRLKPLSLIIALMLLISLPFPQTVSAYGAVSQEKVIDVGKNHFVVLKNDGSVWSWGDHTYGQLGVRNSQISTNHPSAIRRDDGSRLDRIKAIAAGGDHTVALDSDGFVWTWGRNSNGQLGYATPFIGTTNQMNFNADPRRVFVDGQPLVATAIAAGEFHTLAVSSSGQVYAWGSGDSGQNGQTSQAVNPVLVSGLSNITMVAAGANHSLALTANGEVYGWGKNTSGQLGNGQSKHVNPTPGKIDRLTGIMDIAAGDNHTIALAQNRTTVWAWGSNAYGQLGDGGREDRLHPVNVQGIHGVKMIAAGSDHTNAIKEDGTVWAWGRNTSGTKESRTTPIQVKGVNNAFAVGGGGSQDNSYTLAIHHDGTVWKWDQNSYDTTTQLPIFKVVSGIDEVMKKVMYPFVQGGQAVFKYDGDASVQDVQVVGSFNNWVDVPLVRTGNEWKLQVQLPPGKYDYAFRVNGVWTSDPLNNNRGTTNTGDPISYLTVDQYALESPFIKDQDVTFSYSSYDDSGLLEYDAETHYVAVRGSFNEYVEIPMKKQNNNVWTLTQTLPKGDYYYEYVIRNRSTGALTEKRLDPLNSNIYTNPVSGNRINTFTVSEQILNEIPVEKIEFQPKALNMVVGEEKVVLPTFTPSNATDKALAWTSTDDSIVEIVDGKLVAHRRGTTVIVANTKTGKVATLTVTVSPQSGAIEFPKVGYTEMPAKWNVAPNKVWSVKFSKAFDINKVNHSNLSVMDEHGNRMPIGWQIGSDDKTLEVRLQNGNLYKAGATYYLFIEDGIQDKYTQKPLKEKIQMKFQIEL